jgi:uncharacterized cupredoxin-like copper-binding protein
MIKKIFALSFIFVSIGFAQLVAPKAVMNTSEFNFGNIPQGKTASYEFIISNSGGDLLKIQKVSATCGCTAAQPEKNELAPGESTKIKVEFNSTGRMGKQEKYVSINTNDPQNSVIRLLITGNIVEQKQGEKIQQAKIQFIESQHDFGVVAEGKVFDHTFKFINAGKTTLEIKDVKTSCGCTAALLSSKKIEPGKEGTIRVELDTTNRLGRMSRNITVVTNDPEEPNKILTIFAEIKN